MNVCWIKEDTSNADWNVTTNVCDMMTVNRYHFLETRFISNTTQSESAMEQDLHMMATTKVLKLSNCVTGAVESAVVSTRDILQSNHINKL